MPAYHSTARVSAWNYDARDIVPLKERLDERARDPSIPVRIGRCTPPQSTIMTTTGLRETPNQYRGQAEGPASD